MSKYYTRRFLVFFIILSVILIFSLQAQKIKIKQEGKVTVIYNPKDPVSLPATPSKLILTEDLCIGDTSGKEGYVFAALTSIQVDEEGNIFALDGKDNCIKLFDKKGKHITTFGRRGQGPGEIQSPIDMHLDGGKQITILDLRNNRIIYFSKTGEYIKDLSLGKYRLWKCIPDSRKYIYGEIPVFGKKSFMELIKYDHQFKPIMKIASFEIINVNNPPPLELYERFWFDVSHDDSFIWGTNYQYEFTIIDKEGKTIQKIVKDYDPIKITVKYIKREFLKKYPDKPLPTELLKIPDHWPKHFPAFYYFFSDDEGRIYVRTYKRDKQDNIYYDVFDTEGRYFSKFSHLGNELITVIKNKSAYCLIKENQEGIPLIKRYKMEWK